MVDIDSVLDRLKHFFEIGKDVDLAEKLNVTTANLAGYKRRGTIPYEQILVALEKTDADLQWIFYGVPSKTHQPQTGYIQYYSDISSSDANGNINFAGKYEMIQIDAGLFPDLDIKNSLAIRVNSSSMATTYDRDDTVLVDKSKCDIIHGKAYLIEFDRFVSIMRVYIAPGDYYLVGYDNKNYPRYELKAEEFRVIGQIKYKLENVG